MQHSKLVSCNLQKMFARPKPRLSQAIVVAISDPESGYIYNVYNVRLSMGIVKNFCGVNKSIDRFARRLPHRVDHTAEQMCSGQRVTRQVPNMVPCGCPRGREIEVDKEGHHHAEASTAGERQRGMINVIVGRVRCTTLCVCIAIERKNGCFFNNVIGHIEPVIHPGCP
jgi:hypothetical protein